MEEEFEVSKGVKKIIEEVFEGEVKIVRACCHNILRQPMYGKRLQDTVIFHLNNFKRNLLKAMENFGDSSREPAQKRDGGEKA